MMTQRRVFEMVNKMDVATKVQNWINEYWGVGSHNPKSNFHNCEALLDILRQIDEQSRGKPNRPWEFLNAACAQVQTMREIALGTV
jgi:hypothetical protein